MQTSHAHWHHTATIGPVSTEKVVWGEAGVGGELCNRWKAFLSLKFESSKRCQEVWALWEETVPGNDSQLALGLPLGTSLGPNSCHPRKSLSLKAPNGTSVGCVEIITIPAVRPDHCFKPLSHPEAETTNCVEKQ